MAINKLVASAAEAVSDIRDGATVLISGFGGAGFPNVLLGALQDRGVKDLTLVAHSAIHRYSRTHELIQAGMVRKVICTGARRPDGERSPFDELWQSGKIELEMVPQGTFAERIRAGGAGIPAFYSPVSAGTDLAKGKEERLFAGKPHVLEHAIAGDVALVAADTADQYGNLHFRYTQLNFAAVMATAAALTIAEVRKAQETPLGHDAINLPGLYVDRVVVTGAAS